MKKQNNSDQEVQYLPIFMSIGLAIGLAIGAAADKMPLFMCIGLSIGVGIGAALDAGKQKKDQNNSNDKTE